MFSNIISIPLILKYYEILIILRKTLFIYKVYIDFIFKIYCRDDRIGYASLLVDYAFSYL